MCYRDKKNNFQQKIPDLSQLPETMKFDGIRSIQGAISSNSFY